MYNTMVNQNPIVNQFQNYSAQQQLNIPFRNNELISGNVHVSNNLNSLIQQQRAQQNNIQTYQSQITEQYSQPEPESRNNRTSKNKNNISNKAKNIIEDMLKPQKIVKDNKDVKNNFTDRQTEQELIKKGKKKFDITNAPYKVIIKDRIITKKVEDVKQDDILVHKSIKSVDADRKKFDSELGIKKTEKEKINDELKLEFNVGNYDTHKKSFEFKQTFVRNMTYEEKTFDQNKGDYIDFYRKKQKEEEDGKKLCDEILLNLVDDGIISKDELPTMNDAGSQNDTSSQTDTNSQIENKTNSNTSNQSSPHTKQTSKSEKQVSNTNTTRKIIRKQVKVADTQTNATSTTNTTSITNTNNVNNTTTQPSKRIIKREVKSVVIV